MSKDLMPEKLKAFLKGLSPEDQEQVWAFFDGDPSALERMIAIVGKDYSHFPIDFRKKPC